MAPTAKQGNLLPSYRVRPAGTPVLARSRPRKPDLNNGMRLFQFSQLLSVLWGVNSSQGAPNWSVHVKIKVSDRSAFRLSAPQLTAVRPTGVFSAPHWHRQSLSPSLCRLVHWLPLPTLQQLIASVRKRSTRASSQVRSSHACTRPCLHLQAICAMWAGLHGGSRGFHALQPSIQHLARMPAVASGSLQPPTFTQCCQISIPDTTHLPDARPLCRRGPYQHHG